MHHPIAGGQAGITRATLRRLVTATVVGALIAATGAAAASAAEPRTTEATVTSVTNGLTVTVTGTGYESDLPTPSIGGTAAGVYVSLIAEGADAATVTPGSGAYASAFVPNASLAGGLSKALTATAASLPADGEFEVLVWSAHGFANNDTIVARVPVDLSDTQRAQLFSAVPTIAGNTLPGQTLTATVGGTWGDVFDLDYQWFANGVAIDGATGLTFELTTAQLGKTITFSATAIPAEGDPYTATSAATARVTPVTAASVSSTAAGLTVAVSGQSYAIGLPNASTGAPAAGVYAALVPTSLASADVTTSNALAVAYAPKAALNAGLNATLTAPAASLTATSDYDVIVWVAHGNPTADTIVARVPVTLTDDQRAEMIATTPTIAGTAQVGRTLTASTGTWGEQATIAYQWFADGVEIDGATAATFVVAKAQQGKAISVAATSQGANQVTRTSAATANIERKTSVTVSSATSGLTLLVTGQDYTNLPSPNGTSAAAGVYAAIIVAGTDVSAITASAGHIGVAYIPNASIVDGDFAVAVTATAAKVDASANYEVLLWTAHGNPIASSVVGRIPVTLTNAQRSSIVTTTPAIQGLAQVGSTLTADTATWGDKAALTFQWKADGADIAGATESTYVVTDDVVGKAITVAVTGTPTGLPATSRTSSATAQVLGVLVAGNPAVSGTAQVGKVLTANSGTWAEDVTLSYAWLRNGAVIPGATGTSYTLVEEDKGAAIAVRVTGSKVGFASAASASAATASVLGTLAATPVPTVKGTVQVGKVLTATPGTWDSGVTLKYQWYASGKAISGATKSTYTVPGSVYGKTISVKVTGSKAGYASVAKTSVVTAKVKAGTIAKAATPTISGTAKVGKKLTAKVGTWDSGVTKTYQWYANGKAIKGATKSTYTVSKSYKGKTLTVKVTGKKTGYTTVTKTSKATAKVK